MRYPLIADCGGSARWRPYLRRNSGRLINDATNEPRQLQHAFALLESDRCIWCEDAAKAATSHLCECCRMEDPDGLLRREAVLVPAVRITVSA